MVDQGIGQRRPLVVETTSLGSERRKPISLSLRARRVLPSVERRTAIRLAIVTGHFHTIIGGQGPPIKHNFMKIQTIE